MKREIEIRKKRFVVFWLVLVLVCWQIIPITVNAADYAVGDLLSGKTVYAGDKLTYSPPPSTPTDKYSIIYVDYDKQTELGVYNSDDSNTHTVMAYPKLDTLPEGLEFTGWYVESVYVSSGETGSVTLHALVSNKTYQITYELAGGTNGENPSTYTYGTGVAAFADATKEGYTFEGWYRDEQFTQKVESVSDTQTGDIVLYAKFSSNSGLIEKGKVYLESGVQYQLGSGVQSVAGDSSVYGGGIFFYVRQNGEYEFQ